MKFLSLLFFIPLLGQNCSGNATQLKETTLTYTAISRGFNQTLIISNQQISMRSKKTGKFVENMYQIESSDWEMLMELYKNVVLEEIKNLEAPSNKRFHDGAATAQLAIKTKDSMYESQSFDHGNPPQALQPLLEKIISIANKYHDN
jgi:hypothetical protein